MKTNHKIIQITALILIIILITSSSNQLTATIPNQPTPENITTPTIQTEPEENNKPTIPLTIQTYGLPGKQNYKTYLTSEDANNLMQQIQHLQQTIQNNPTSPYIPHLQQQLIQNLQQHHLIPNNPTTNKLLTQLQKQPITQPKATHTTNENHATAWFCNFLTTGTGSVFPIIILPRLIPFLLTPIPRLFVRWKTNDGITSCGSLTTGKGFIATEMQDGFALGFWGIGFSIFIPPICTYGLLGYALFASVNAEHIEPWPPNEPPEITPLQPPDEGENISISTTELEFSLTDINHNLMNYTVTTQPHIGTGSGTNVTDGTYTIPITGLEGTETYTWTVIANDGTNHQQETFSFQTEPVAPVVLNPEPYDNQKFIPITTTHLKFTLKDYQGDLMDYTVETTPNIGSSSATNVPDGTYTTPITNLQNLTTYKWYVNVTDGTNWKHKTFTFQTEPQMIFNPFQEGWQYRKQITIDYTQVPADLTNFPILISTTDTDLRDKAQPDGDDILFMNGPGTATRLYHEIEHYDTTTGKLIAWVNLTTLTSTQNTNLYLYYGNSQSQNQQTSQKVWDSNYLLIYHCNEVSGNLIDSTIYKRDTIKVCGNPIYQQPGKIGYAVELPNDNDYFDIIENLNIRTSDFTLEAWGYAKNWASNGEGNTLLCLKGEMKCNMVNYPNEEGDTQAWIGINNDDHRLAFVENGAPNTNTWYQYTFRYDRDGEGAETYLNSLLTDSDPVNGNVDSKSLTNRLGTGSGTGDSYGWCGLLDEIRISNTARNNEWIITQYNNCNNPDSFHAFGPEEIN